MTDRTNLQGGTLVVRSPDPLDPNFRIPTENELDLAHALKQATGLGVVVFVDSEKYDDGEVRRWTELWCYNPAQKGMHHGHDFALDERQKAEVRGFVRGFVAGLTIEL